MGSGAAPEPLPSEARPEPRAKGSLPPLRAGLRPKGSLLEELLKPAAAGARAAPEDDELEVSPPKSLDLGSLLCVRAAALGSHELEEWDDEVVGRATLSLGDELVSMRNTSPEETESLRVLGGSRPRSVERSRSRPRSLGDELKNPADEVGG